MRKLYCTILFLISISVSQAQEILSQPEAKLITRFPFKQYSGGVMVVQALFGNIKDTLNFILDTGSGGISLDSATCVEFKIPLRPTDTTITGIGGIRKVSFAFDQQLQLPGLTVRHLNFHVNDYEVLSSVYGEKVDGIIGYSFFNRYIVKLNFDSNMVEVYTPGKISYPREGTTLHPVFTALPIQWLQVKDRKKTNFNFYFDTGAGLCVLLNSDFIRDSSILNQEKKPLPTQAQGMGGKTNMMVTTMKEFRLGPYKFKNIPIHIFEDEYNVTSYPYLAGLIGNDILRRFNIILNYDKRTFYLMPNSHYRDPFDYSYTGLGLYWVDNEIRVGDVMKDSPADKAGFKVDDVVIAVNNNLSQNLQLYKSMLQNAGDKVRFVVKRPEGLVELNMKIKSIL